MGATFLQQALRIKELDSRFNFNRVVIDANGIGTALVEVLMTENTDINNGLIYPPYNVDNIKDYPDYNSEQKIGAAPKLYLIKTNQSNAGTIHSTAYGELFSGKGEIVSRYESSQTKTLSTRKGSRMGPY